MKNTNKAKKTKTVKKYNYIVDIALMLPQMKVKAINENDALERVNEKMLKLNPIEFMSDWATNISNKNIYITVRKSK